MKEFLITLFLGEFGVHRFMKKKYITGALWLCTLGLCGIGWAVDTIIAFVKMLNESKTASQPVAYQQVTKTEQKFGGGYSFAKTY